MADKTTDTNTNKAPETTSAAPTNAKQARRQSLNEQRTTTSDAAGAPVPTPAVPHEPITSGPAEPLPADEPVQDVDPVESAPEVDNPVSVDSAAEAGNADISEDEAVATPPAEIAPAAAPEAEVKTAAPASIDKTAATDTDVTPGA